MFKLLRLLFETVFRLLGIPNPTFNVDTALTLAFLLVYLVAVPAFWCSSAIDLGGKLGATAVLTAILLICIHHTRAQSRRSSRPDDRHP